MDVLVIFDILFVEFVIISHFLKIANLSLILDGEYFFSEMSCLSNLDSLEFTI